MEAFYFSGAIYDWQGSYTLVFVLMAVGYFLAGVGMVVIEIINKCRLKVKTNFTIQ